MRSLITDVPMYAITMALQQLGFKIQHKSNSITARYGGVFKTDGKYCTIHVADRDGKRYLMEELEDISAPKSKVTLTKGRMDQVINLAQTIADDPRTKR